MILVISVGCLVVFASPIVFWLVLLISDRISDDFNDFGSECL